jgi:hypothetical protein
MYALVLSDVKNMQQILPVLSNFVGPLSTWTVVQGKVCE